MILMLIILLAFTLLIVGVAIVLIAGLPIWLICIKTVVECYIGYLIVKAIKRKKERKERS